MAARELSPPVRQAGFVCLLVALRPSRVKGVMASRRAACATRSLPAAAMTACSQFCRSATDVLSVISLPPACGSLDREDSLEDGNLHRISSPRSCGAGSEESETLPPDRTCIPQDLVRQDPHDTRVLVAFPPKLDS